MITHLICDYSVDIWIDLQRFLVFEGILFLHIIWRNPPRAWRLRKPNSRAHRIPKCFQMCSYASTICHNRICSGVGLDVSDLIFQNASQRISPYDMEKWVFQKTKFQSISYPKMIPNVFIWISISINKDYFEYVEAILGSLGNFHFFVKVVSRRAHESFKDHSCLIYQRQLWLDYCSRKHVLLLSSLQNIAEYRNHHNPFEFHPIALCKRSWS